MSSDLDHGSNTSQPTLPPTSSTTASHEIVGIGSLLFVLIILLTLFSSKLIELFKFNYINESIISILFGMIIGIIITFFPSSTTDLFSFDSEFFFFVLLPPIVFEAGFSLKRKHFFRNLGSILLFAIIGTVISTLIIGFGLYTLSFLNILPLYNSGNPLECLLFGALISAVDPVGTLAVLNKPSLNIDPTLYSLIFGESVLNDAVSIVLYKIFNDYSDTGIIISFESHFFVLIGQFCGIFIGSFFIGIIIALCASVILKYALHLLFTEQINSNMNIELQQSSKHNNVSNIMNEMSIDCDNFESEMDDFNENKSIIYLDEYRHNEISESPSLEFSIVILFAYLSYNLGEVLHLSGIVSVFSCGICISHYAWYNLHWVAQISLHHIIVALSKCCENFVYAYLGISTVLSFTPSTNEYGWNILLILFTIILCIISRAANIFPLSKIANVKRRIKISFNMQIMMFFSGLRGAIAFALALNINTQHSDLIVTTTLTIVILTTILCGCTTKYMVDKLKLNNNKSNVCSTKNQNNNTNEKYHKLNKSKLKNDSKDMDIDSSMEIIESPTFTFTLDKNGNNEYYGIHKYWHNFDRNYMQMIFGGSMNPCFRHKHIGIYPNRNQVE